MPDGMPSGAHELLLALPTINVARCACLVATIGVPHTRHARLFARKPAIPARNSPVYRRLQKIFQRCTALLNRTQQHRLITRASNSHSASDSDDASRSDGSPPQTEIRWHRYSLPLPPLVIHQPRFNRRFFLLALLMQYSPLKSSLSGSGPRWASTLSLPALWSTARHQSGADRCSAHFTVAHHQINMVMLFRGKFFGRMRRLPDIPK